MADDLTYKTLVAQVDALAKEVALTGEALKERAQALDESAKETSGVANMIASLGVDPDTVNECRELANVTAGLSNSVTIFVASTDATQAAARSAAGQAHRTHAGIQEAVTRSQVTDICGIDRHWFEQQ